MSNVNGTTVTSETLNWVIFTKVYINLLFSLYIKPATDKKAQGWMRSTLKAIEMLRSGIQFEFDTTTKLLHVVSSSTPKVIHTTGLHFINAGSLPCDCKGSQYHKHCWHRALRGLLIHYWNLSNIAERYSWNSEGLSVQPMPKTLLAIRVCDNDSIAFDYTQYGSDKIIQWVKDTCRDFGYIVVSNRSRTVVLTLNKCWDRDSIQAFIQRLWDNSITKLEVETEL